MCCFSDETGRSWRGKRNKLKKFSLEWKKEKVRLFAGKNGVHFRLFCFTLQNIPLKNIGTESLKEIQWWWRRFSGIIVKRLMTRKKSHHFFPSFVCAERCLCISWDGKKKFVSEASDVSDGLKGRGKISLLKEGKNCVLSNWPPT